MRRDLIVPVMNDGNLYSSGGHHPALTQERRVTVISELLSLSASTVALPHSVSPRSCVPSLLHRKCSDQYCKRGLKRSASCPLSGSIACVRIPLNPLQRRHANQRFSSSSVPPIARASKCSISSGVPNNVSLDKQYPQRNRACRRILLRKESGIFARLRFMRETLFAFGVQLRLATDGHGSAIKPQPALYAASLDRLAFAALPIVVALCQSNHQLVVFATGY